MGYRILAVLLMFSSGMSAQDGLDFAEYLDEEDLTEAKRELLTEYAGQLDINHSDSVSLVRSGFFTPDQAANILRHIHNNGQLVSVLELQVIDGITVELVERVAPFIRMDLEHSAVESRSELVLRLERSFGREPNHWQGNAIRQMMRFKHKAKTIQLSLLVEKDKGEKVQWNPSMKMFGPDFYSGSLQWNKGRTRVILGDYGLQTGEGLVFSSGLSLGKNQESILTLKKAFSGIRSYTSASEVGFLRGGVVESTVGKSRIRVLGSRIWRDATLYESDGMYFKSFRTDGYHRTSTELASRKSVKEWVVGVNVERKISRGVVGLNINKTHWSISKQPDKVTKNQFSFRGNQLTNGSIYTSSTWRNSYSFSELAFSERSIAYLTGLMVNLSQETELGLIYRDYGKSYFTPLGRAFGEYYLTQNERGIYLGLTHRPSSKVKLSGYFDYFLFPWVKSNTMAESTGYEWLLNMQLKSKSGMVLVGRWRTEVKEENDLELRRSEVRKHNYQLKWSFPVTENIELRGRHQGSRSVRAGNASTGVLTSSEVIYSTGGWSLSSRFMVFDTQSYENRQYVFERDMLYSFSLPSFSGKGYRWYALIKHKLGRNLTFWIRYAGTRHIDIVHRLPTMSQGRRRATELKFQLRYNFNN